nr:hypothetical protein GCM10017611_52880 [Rhodococcus wratislaviensis]
MGEVNAIARYRFIAPVSHLYRVPRAQAVVSDADSAKDELLSAPADEFAAALKQLEGSRPGTSSGADTSRRRSANEQAARLRDEIRDKRRMPTATLA